MDCYNWRNCEGSCDHCEVAGMEAAKAVQAWDDPEYLVNNWSPEEVLEFLQQLGRQAEVAEQGRQALENHVRGSREQLQEEQEARRRNKEVAAAWMATAKRSRRERDELLRTFAHTHVSIPPSKKVELDDDTCAKCGLDLRHPIHKPEEDLFLPYPD